MKFPHCSYAFHELDMLSASVACILAIWNGNGSLPIYRVAEAARGKKRPLKKVYLCQEHMLAVKQFNVFAVQATCKMHFLGV